MFFIVLLNVYITNRHETSYNSSCPIKNGMCNLFKIAINIGVIGPFTRVRELYSPNHFPCKILFACFSISASSYLFSGMYFIGCTEIRYIFRRIKSIIIIVVVILFFIFYPLFYCYISI